VERRKNHTATAQAVGAAGTVQVRAAWGLQVADPAAALTLLVTGVLTCACGYCTVRAPRQAAKSPFEAEREQQQAGRERAGVTDGARAVGGAARGRAP